MKTTSAAIERYVPALSRLVTPERLQHCLDVAEIMGVLAPIYDLDGARAMTAGLLHDAAKDLTPTEQSHLLRDAGIKPLCPAERHPVYMHAPAGAILAQDGFRIGDPQILAAIACHSYGGSWPALNHPLASCLRLADVLGPIEPWFGMAKLETYAMAGRLIESTLLHAHWVTELFQARQIPRHPNLLRVRRELAAKLQPLPSFLARKGGAISVLGRIHDHNVI
jgi:predicted HD superfamily hydrolase involved in NAD metabolism